MANTQKKKHVINEQEVNFINHPDGGNISKNILRVFLRTVVQSDYQLAFDGLLFAYVCALTCLHLIAHILAIVKKQMFYVQIKIVFGNILQNSCSGINDVPQKYCFHFPRRRTLVSV